MRFIQGLFPGIYYFHYLLIFTSLIFNYNYNINIVITNTSFLALFFKTFASLIVIFFIEKAFDIEKISFFFFFLSNSIDSDYRRVLAMTFFLATILLKTFLVVLVPFIG